MTDVLHRPSVASHPDQTARTVVSEVAGILRRVGVARAFGVSGGAMAAFWDALSASPIAVHHFRHESGAGFAALEASLASGRPALLFTTTGPGLLNAMTSIVSAREERAQVIVVSPYTSAAARGRFPIQETTRATLPAPWYEPGHPFHFAAVVDDPGQLPEIERSLRAGLHRRDGFVAHLAIDTSVQRAAVRAVRPPEVLDPEPPDSPTLERIADCVEALSDGPFAIWAGYGARHAAPEVALLARRMRAPVMCSPRGKGVFPEDDPLFVGVTGLAGHASVMEFVETWKPRRILVLGSRLGESTSFWDRRLVPPQGFVHLDVDAEVPGRAFPDAPTLAVTGDIVVTLQAVLADLWPTCDHPAGPLPHPSVVRLERRPEGLVRPEALMDALQDRVVEGSDAILLAESGHSFLWTTHRLRFAAPRRYRISNNIGSMGHAAAGVVGVALATGRTAVAVVGDGALLMTNEINSAVKYGACAVWVVLNDGRYGMCEQGMESLGLSADARIPQVDFAAFAHAQGADAVRVDHETQLEPAIEQAMAARGPFVIDVRIDPASRAPASQRNAALAKLAAHQERVFPSSGEE